MRNFITRFVREEDGMEMVEWAIVAAVFALAGYAAWDRLGDTMASAIDTIGANITDATDDGLGV